MGIIIHHDNHDIEHRDSDGKTIAYYKREVKLTKWEIWFTRFVYLALFILLSYVCYFER